MLLFVLVRSILLTQRKVWSPPTCSAFSAIHHWKHISVYQRCQVLTCCGQNMIIVAKESFCLHKLGQERYSAPESCLQTPTECRKSSGILQQHFHRVKHLPQELESPSVTMLCPHWQLLKSHQISSLVLEIIYYEAKVSAKFLQAIFSIFLKAISIVMYVEEMLWRYKSIKKTNSPFLPQFKGKERQNTQTFGLRGQEVLLWAPLVGSRAKCPPPWNRALTPNVLLFLYLCLLQKQGSKTPTLEERRWAFKWGNLARGGRYFLAAGVKVALTFKPLWILAHPEAPRILLGADPLGIPSWGAGPSTGTVQETRAEGTLLRRLLTHPISLRSFLYTEKLSLCNLDALTFGYSCNVSEMEWPLCYIWRGY